MGILPIPRSLRKHLMVNGLYKVLLRFYLPSTIFRLFPPQLIDTQIQRRLEDTFVIFQPLRLSTSRRGASARHTLHQNLHKIQLHILYLVITFCVYSLVKDLGLECHPLSFTEHRAYLQYKFI